MPSEPESMTPYQKLCERFLLEMLNSYDSETLSRTGIQGNSEKSD